MITVVKFPDGCIFSCTYFPLTMGDRESFTEWVLSKTGAFPDAYRRIGGINIGLEAPGETELDELEAGRNQCALG